MCIRDSNNIDATESDPMFVDAASADFHLVAGSPAVNQALCCLLYTSDAADERSSVDLGGRRIIKKKNE